ncbi:glycine betaine ABC transporter substrate-binding protein [Kushneria aurantia]|uniref:Glycine betaine ABC transporter substrate-binding protein n=1 Tax=Kushneria aurantia TaxID=504092 RepID=A0ABV6G488_9GAMM|nr:glycine betaine ABC transporter substrate-binding protein [Kushneria aurantia]
MNFRASNGYSLIGAFAFAALTGANPASAEARDNSINLAYVEWPDAIVSTNVMRVVLEDAGFEVETSLLSAAAMWQAVASGEADAMVDAWLPTTQQEYYQRHEDQVVDLGANLDGTRQGLVVPDYVDNVASIGDLADHAGEFDDRIVGIDPGDGIMQRTEAAMATYGLADMNLVGVSDATMIDALESAIDSNEAIVVTGWTPHWMFARWDLRYLDDPEHAYGGAEQIHTIVRQGLREEMPVATCILDNFQWTPETINQAMLMNQQEDATAYDNARQWVNNHQDVVSAWTQGCAQE